MSGPMSMQTAIAAAGHAFAAEAAAFGVSPRELAMIKGKAAMLTAAEEKAKATGQTAQQRDWASIPHRVRVQLVNLGARSPGDAYARAKLRWDQFSAEDQRSMAQVREDLLAGLVGRDSLSW